MARQQFKPDFPAEEQDPAAEQAQEPAQEPAGYDELAGQAQASPDAEDASEAPETPGETPDAEDQAEGPEQPGEGGQQVTPEQQAKIKRTALAVQAVLGSKQYSARIVGMCKDDQGIVMASMLLLDTVSGQGKRIGSDFIIQAAAITVTVLLDFLTSIKRYQPDPKHFSTLLGQVIARAAKQYGVPPQQVGRLVASAPSPMRGGMNAQAAGSGLLGRMMSRAGIQPPAGVTSSGGV